MATTKGFLFGVITGAVIVWWLRDSIARSIDARTRTIRARAAHGLQSAADALETGLAGAPVPDQPPRIGRAS